MINDQFFVHLFTFSVSQPHFVETSQSTADNYLSFEKTHVRHIGLLTFGLHFDPVNDEISSQYDNSQGAVMISCRFSSWRHRWRSTTSGLKKQPSAILEFFQRLRCRSDYSKLCAIVHQAPNFPPNRTIRDGVITSYTTSRWQPGGALLLYFRFRIYMTQTLLFWRWNLCHPPPPPNVYAIRWQKFCSCWSSSLEWSTVCTPDLAFDRFKPGLKNYLFTLVWWDLSA